MSVVPGERLIKTREVLQREFDLYQAASRQRISYGASIAKWLISQLPAADPAQLGWGIIAVTAQLLPESPILKQGKPGEKPGTRSGQRFSLLVASRVGETLLTSTEIPADRQVPGSPEVGPELAQIDLSEAYANFTGLPSSESPVKDPAQLRREFAAYMADELQEIRRNLTDELPGADTGAIGWALIGTGMVLLAQENQAPPAKGWRRSTREREQTARNHAMTAALLLACIGDWLANPEA
jgi:hypothetical protein